MTLLYALLASSPSVAARPIILACPHPAAWVVLEAAWFGDSDGIMIKNGAILGRAEYAAELIEAI